MLSRQRTTIPVFIKERKSDRGFKYVGRQRAQAFRMVAGIIEAAQRRSGREDLAGVLELQRAGDY